ncbi:MAG TPA: hypothetical protein GX505_09785 [Clostridiales bacterium]|nr:hypothetical protein [Clostridiales bacterium]
MYRLENEFLSVEFDEYGRLTYLKNKESQYGNIITSPAEDSFRVIFKKGQNWENVAFGSKQEFTVTEKDGSIEFSVKKTKVRDFIADISLTLIAALDRENLVFDAVINNNEEGALITDFYYPIIGTVKTLAGGKPALLWPHQSGEKYYNIGEYLARKGPSREIFNHSLSMTYPGHGSMQWMALEDKDQVLYIASHDNDFYATELRAKGSSIDRGAITLTINKMAFVKYEEAWHAPPAVLKLYTGTWHHGAHDYMEWTKTWRTYHHVPQWVRDMMGYYLVINKQQYGHEMWKYNTLPKLYQKAVETGCDTLGLFGWYDSGHDNKYPDLEVSESLGGAQMLKDNIKAVQKMGGKVTLYYQGHLIDITTDFYNNGGSNYEIKSKDGVPYYEQYNKSHESTFLKNYTRKTFSTACPSCPEWQSLMKEKADFISDFGADGVLYDQIGGIPPKPCFDNRHPHAKGKPSLSMSNGRKELLNGIQNRTKEIDKEFAFFTEVITDLYSTYVDCLHGICAYPSREGNRLDVGLDNERVEVINYPELFRYCFSDIIITLRNQYPYISPRVANYAFTFGYRYEMEIRYQADCDDVLNNTYAEYNEYARKVTELRRKYWDVLGYGTFMDTHHITCNNPGIIAKSYVNGNKLAVAIWNDTDKDAVLDLQVKDYKLIEVSTVDDTFTALPGKLLPQQIAVALFENQQHD